VIVSGGSVVVDPSRHVSWYEEFVASRGAKVSRVLDTHVHADHVSGGRSCRAIGRPYFVAAGEVFDMRRNVRPLCGRRTEFRSAAAFRSA
jgi:glyoxylase-like metal-dependent hydrolase (beta-lactamase superfamily II)